MFLNFRFELLGIYSGKLYTKRKQQSISTDTSSNLQETEANFILGNTGYRSIPTSIMKSRLVKPFKPFFQWIPCILLSRQLNNFPITHLVAISVPLLKQFVILECSSSLSPCVKILLIRPNSYQMYNPPWKFPCPPKLIRSRIHWNFYKTSFIPNDTITLHYNRTISIHVLYPLFDYNVFKGHKIFLFVFIPLLSHAMLGIYQNLNKYLIKWRKGGYYFSVHI